MTNLLKSLVVFIFVFCALTVRAADPNAAKEALAVTAATEWLALLDKKLYKQSWEEAAILFRSKVTTREWEKTIADVRSPFGTLISRKIKAKIYTTTLPGVDQGEYVVIQFQSQFQNRKDVLETVTPMLDDTKWRVSGYYAR